MTELSNVLKTYQDNALKTLQGPASLFYNTHQYHTSKGLKREIDSPPPPPPPPPSSDDDYKHTSPTPMQCSITIPPGAVIERAESNRPQQISSSPPLSSEQQQQQQQPPQQQREYCQSPPPPPPPIAFVPMMQPIQSQPILTAPDSECGELMECILEGRTIGCFQLGGELRLCFPQILNNILPDFPLDRIHRTIEDLHISCLQSTPEQLAEFKHAKILPPNVPPCGLITRTNAERLCSALLHKSAKKKELAHQSYFSFRVYHRCFGKCEGICTPDLFTFRDRECIECVECHGMLAPNKFVLHVCKNKPKENFTCHWGFESNKWRSYIHVAMSEPNQEKCTRLLDDMFAIECDFERVLFEHSQMEDSSHSLKRKAALEEVTTLSSSQTKQESGYDIPLKKTKMDETQMAQYIREFYPATLLYQFSQLSRQQSWLTAPSPKQIISPFSASIPYLSSTQEPPILQNPERVVRHTENERFDRSYQPNVALAPRQTILAKEREREQREYEKERETSERASSVIKRETIQIKQERPSTPNTHELSPELRHTSPETTVVLTVEATNGQQDTKASVAAPISPENQSGSNEITSSTSPVPATPSSMIPNKQESVSPPHHHHHHLHRSTSPRSHHHHHHLINHHVSIGHHKKSTSSSSSSSPPPPTVVVKMTSGAPLNGIKKAALIGNPEFELSTDTDDESLGEPDSSNHIGAGIGSLAQSPSEFVAILLKNNSHDDHKKILDLVQYMEKEILQSKEAHKKETRLVDELRKEIDQLKSQLSQQHKMSVIATAAAANTACLSSSSSSSSSSLSSNSSFDFEQQQRNNGERRNSIVATTVTATVAVNEKPNVIIKPPKKSILRITPLLDNDCKPTANNNNNNVNNINNNNNNNTSNGNSNNNNNNNSNSNNSSSVSVSINNSQSTTTPSIVIKMPKCEDIINNNNTKMYNNNNNSNSSSNTSSSTTSSTTTATVMNGQTPPTDSSTASSNDLQKTAIKAEKL